MDLNKSQNMDVKKNKYITTFKQPINTKKFIDHMRYLPLHDQFFIEYRNNIGEWNKLFDARFEMPYLPKIRCNICPKQIKLQNFVEHLLLPEHRVGLEQVEQIFHPAYTYTKESTKLARGERVSQDELKEAIASAKSEISTLYNSKIVSTVRLFVRDMLRSSSLVAEAWLPLNEFVALEFCMSPDNWEPMISTKNLQPNGIYDCNLCTVTCHGIITVNSHFNGLAHSRMQLKCHAIRSKTHRHLNKHCLIRYAERHSFRVHNKAAWLELKSGKHPNTAAELSAVNKDITEIKCSIENEGLIGVEYVVKVINEANEMVMYECCLCEADHSDSEDMQMHLISFSHRLKYCEKHYGLTLNEFKTLIGTTKYVNYVRTMSYILHRLAGAIEQAHSRAVPLEIDEEKFENMRPQIMMQVYDLPHASQDYDPDFINILNNEEIQDLRSSKIVYVQTQKISGECWARFLALPDKGYLNQKVVVRIVKHNVRTSRYSESPRMPLTNEIEESSESLHNYDRSHNSMCNIVSEVYDESRVISTRSPTTEAEEAVEQLYEDYRHSPESHPLYDKEWNLFWKRRKNELITLGIDYSSYNFQPEWVKYFKQRLEELYSESLNVIKAAKVEYPPPPPLQESGLKRKVERNNSYHIDPNKKVRLQDNYQLPEENEVVKLTNSTNIRSHTLSGINNRSNTIHVLRLLTAVEDYLGSLGCKILDLLSKALSLEKITTQPEQLDKKLLTPDNCTLLETANEKLKGILYAGFLEKSKIQAFNRVIDHTSALLKLADEKGWTIYDTEYKEESEEKSRNIGLGNVLNKLQKEVVTPPDSVENMSSQKSTLPLLQFNATGNTNPGSSKSFRYFNVTNSTSLRRPNSGGFKQKSTNSWRSDNLASSNFDNNSGTLYPQDLAPVDEVGIASQTQSIQSTNFGNMRSYNGNDRNGNHNKTFQDGSGNRNRATYWRQNSQF